MKFNLKKYIHPIIAGVVSLILAVALIVGNALCFVNYNLVTAFLCGYGFDENSEEAKAARESGMALAEDVEEDGAVLLKNNGALPLKTNKVNVFGWTGSDGGFIPQGTGSGTGSRNDLVSFLGGLKAAGIEYNEELAKAYDNLGWKRVEGGSYVIEAIGEEAYHKFYGVTEAPESFYTSELMNNAKAYSNTAIVVLGRILGEGNDYSHYQYVNRGEDDRNRRLQSISALEEVLIKQATDNFENVIIVTNTTNPMELGFADDDKIDAVLHMGTPGTRGTIGVANLLSGKANPSGKLADTWAYNLSTAASFATSGREGVGSYTDISSDTSLNNRQNKYSEYLENIYTGYMWYETADAEGFWDTQYAKERWGISKGYEDVVQYPFGYGLSYTTFDWLVNSVQLVRKGTVVNDNVTNGATIAKDDKLVIEVNVTNTGDVAGKDVVELYYSAPYTKGGIEKSAIKLGTFAKTPLLQPKQFATLKLEMDISTMKSYDCYDKNNNGFMGYELEKGDYTISLRTDVHTLKETLDGVNSIKLNVASDIKYENDTTTGKPVTNQFTTYTNTTSGASSTVNEPFANKPHSIDGADNSGDKITYMTRENFVTTFPEVENIAFTKNAGNVKADVHDLSNVKFEEEGVVAPKFGSKETSWTIQDLFGVPYGDDMWNELVSQLDFDTACTLITRAGFGTIEISSIGKPKTYDTDGPSGFNTNVTGGNGLRAVCYPSSTVLAQTWDWYMAYQVGLAIGIEGNALGIDGWYGPGANLHRSPLGGRNFEYYSEDPQLAGIMCAYHVLGAKEKGVISYIKHIGPNECDTGRNGAYKWLTEQSLRENYLYPFELAVKIGGSNGLMASVDRVGGARGTGSYAMLTAVVRNEWGFNGTVITDYYQSGIVNDIDEGIRAGNSQVLHPDGAKSWFDDSSSNTAKYYIHKSAKDILFSYAETKNFAETAQGLESGALIGETREVFAWWVPLIIIIDVTAAGLMAFWIFMALRKVNKQDAEILTVSDGEQITED